MQEAAEVDEDHLKQEARTNHLSVEQTVLRLAAAKAMKVGTLHPDKFVLGADQILDCDGQWFDKPENLLAARQHLSQLRGKRHRLVNGLVIVRAGETVWTHTAIATLEMRAFSDEFLDTYLHQSGERILGSVGAYLLEAQGVQLFNAIEGDYFTILGLPLLPLLGFLRDQTLIEF